MSGEERSHPEQLLASARRGDRSAWGRLLEQYRGYLRLLVRMQLDEHLEGKVDASDVVQETFMDAHRDFANFRGTREAELMAWLRQILAGNLLDQMRRYLGTQRRDVRRERQLSQQLNESSAALNENLQLSESSPSERATRRERAALVADALEQLPDRYRRVLVLRHLKGLTFPEIARQMDGSVGSIQKLWTRALARLRETLREDPWGNN